MSLPPERVRIDKWLWAARFFRTRALAKKAIESGQITCDGQRPKASREIGAGAVLGIRRGHVEQIVHVDAVSDVRRGAPEAQALYTETVDSIERREQARLDRQFANLGLTMPGGRPTKRDRRALQRLQQSSGDAGEDGP